MRVIPTQMNLPIPSIGPINKPSKKPPRANGIANKLGQEDRVVHEWYRFVLSFPPHLVRDYIDNFGLNQKHVILDPFCGTGTTLIESRLSGIRPVGIEANKFAYFATSIKLDWSLNSMNLVGGAREVAKSADHTLRSQGIQDDRPFETNLSKLKLRTLDPDSARLLLTNSISPLPLHKVLVLLSHLRKYEREDFYRHALLALANALVFRISNLHFGPEVGVQSIRDDVPVISSWLAEVEKIASDLALVQSRRFPPAKVLFGDARCIDNLLGPGMIDAVITSPPYPNEKDYTRTTRLESVILGFIQNRLELRDLKKKLIRSNTRGVYKGDDDDKWVTQNPKIQKISNSIEKRRRDLGKNSGFEKLYGRVTRLYFGGMARHLSSLRKVLCDGAQLAYIVGDQASYLRVMIRTGQLLAEMAEALGYEHIRTDLFRTRFSSTTRDQLREEVVILRWQR